MDIRRRGFLATKYKSSSPTSEGSYTINLKDKWRLSSTIPNPDSSKYDGVYESFSNYNVGNTGATMTITITGYTTFRLYIRSYAESSYDYVMVSQLDLGIDNNTSYSNTTLVKTHTRGNLKSGTAIGDYTLVEYTNIDGGTHDINITYRKDSSVNSGDDRGYLLIEGGGGSEVETPGEDIEEDYVITYTSTDGNIVTPYKSSNFGATLVSNTYEDVGIILFNGPITRIGYDAFNNCDSLANITIPNSVTSIGEDAFYDCDGLTSITIPNSVTSIDQRAFEYCNALASVAIGTSVTSIGTSAFEGCTGLTSIEIPNSVTSIGGYMFKNCSNLTSVVIPNRVTHIGSSTFQGCSGLTSVTIPNSVTNIGDWAFMDCSGLTSLTIGNGVTSIGDRAFDGCTKFTSIVVGEGNKKYDSRNNCNAMIETATNTLIMGSNTSVIPDGVISIGGSAFIGRSVLTSIVIPNSVTSIGRKAFSGCSSLANITIGDGVTSIGDMAFRGCKSIASITIGNSITSIGDAAFYECTIKEVHAKDIAAWCNISFIDSYSNPIYHAKNLYLNGILIKDLVIPEGVENIKDYAFYKCRCLVSVTIPNSVTSIGDSAFEYCDNLANVTIGNSVTSIGNYAFYDCSLTSVTIGNSVTSIGDDAFRDCSLKSVTIPNSVKSIGDRAFYGCGLTSLMIPNSVTSIGYHAFGSGSLTSIIVESGNRVYDSRDNCNAIIETATNTLVTGCDNTIIPNSVTSIGDDAFMGCLGFKNITIHNNIISIGSSVFHYCYGLKNVTIGNGVTNIGNTAFYYCDNLESITIGNSVTNIGENAFGYCKKLTSIYNNNNTPPIVYSNTFNKVPSNCVIYVPMSAVSAYKAALYWNSFTIQGYEF